MLKGAPQRFAHDLVEFSQFLVFYAKKKTVVSSRSFERNKNYLVKFFLMKRGRYNRPFLHLTTMGVLSLGMFIAPALADTYPVFSSKASVLSASTSATQESVNVDQNVFSTQISQKPRDQIVTYTVEKGDTVESIAQKFSQSNNPISADTIRWANNLTDDNINVGDQLKILPVTGVAHKVQPGDTIYSIAQTYGVSAQNIIDFPFNTFANNETFALVTGYELIVPGGHPPAVQVAEPTPYIARSNGPAPVSQGGWFFPVPQNSVITQYASWYHMAIDIAGPVGTPVYAAHSGTVSYVSVGTYDTGYGTNVWVDDGDGIKTHYAHLSQVNVSVGQSVIGGQTVVGLRGNTGRSTGPHTHFEISVNGTLVNPLQYVSMP